MKKTLPTSDPPQWGKDELSVFLQNTDYNSRINSARFPGVFSLLQDIYSILHNVQEIIETDKEKKIIPKILIYRHHSSILAAIRLALSGQPPESFSILRTAIEQVWYALHIARDPNPPERQDIWRNRNNDDFSISHCKTEFSIKNVLLTHEKFDHSTSKHLHDLYENTIDFGAHPNPRGVLATVNGTIQSDENGYRVVILTDEGIPVTNALHKIALVFMFALRITDIIYPTRFRIMNLDNRIATLKTKIDNSFQIINDPGIK